MKAEEIKKIFRQVEIIVVKIGTNVLSTSDCRLDSDIIGELARQVSELKKNGKKVVIVSSGAITAGMGLLGFRKKPRTIPEEQASAAAGQGHLMSVYTNHFSRFGIPAAQVLLTQADLRDRKRYVNASNTLMTLLEKGAVPVVNENDTVAVDELIFGDRFGDNDILSALVANLVGAGLLIMLTDVDGLMETGGGIIRVVEKIDSKLKRHLTKQKSPFGKGGMENKLRAVKIFTDSGDPAVIAGGRVPNVIPRIISGEPVGTLFLPGKTRIYARKRWIAFTLQARGSITIDSGACRALEKGRSLLPGGIIGTSGKFKAGDAVSICSPSGAEIARGIANYSFDETGKIKSLKSSDIERVLGAKPYEEVVHRNNMVFLAEEDINESRT